ncbi:MAG: TonB-dependent receptor, partial [Thermoflexibacter sp.]|nr:TonB-dependent receptor [Thermoflexibacter sp.]
MLKNILVALLMSAMIGRIVPLCAQDRSMADTLKTMNLHEVVVTATRTEKLLSSVPMPVTIINQQQIRQMGSLRLNEILQEQTGLAIVNDHGQGIQMQGFNPDYTLILVDGEPLIGRTAGTLELSRIAVGNIKQIEIVKGPSSSLYGSEALAGVVNIITENPKETSGRLSMRYGANRTSDLTGSINLKKEKLGLYAFANRYGTGGYDFTPTVFGNTVEPFHSYTFQSKMNYDFSQKLKFKMSGRYFLENQQSNFDIGTLQQPQYIGGKGLVKDFNFNPTLDWLVSQKFKVQFRYYQSRYETNSTLNYYTDNQLYEQTFFRQTFQRPEVQAVYFLNDKNIITSGVGTIGESVEATRYEGIKRFSTNYAFFQYEFIPVKKLSMILGGRLDSHSSYGSQFSPKISAQYQWSEKIALRGSVGVGFKSPDFRQLYLNFNNAVAGYSVFGSEEIGAVLERLQQQNQIAEILLSPNEIGTLKAERSIAYNLGVKIVPNEQLIWNINIFRNDVSNLIENQVFARRTNGQNIFGYRNLNRIFTQGFETDVNYRINARFTLSAGYQYLLAKDKEIINQIERGEVFQRDPQTLITTRVTL